MSKIRPCLWYDGQAEEAAEFYVSVFPESRIDLIQRGPMDWPGGKAGGVILVEFTLAGEQYQALNGGPFATFNEAISLSVSCEDQAEVDRVWDALQEGGGEPIQCGWLKDRYGLRWQVVPKGFEELMRDPDPERAARVMAALNEMIKLDLAAAKKAWKG